MTRSHDESELVRQIISGNEPAATLLDEKYRKRLEFVAIKHGVPTEDARDLAQDVLANAMLQIRGGLFRGESTIGTWLYAILRLKMADYWRRSHRDPLLLTNNEVATAGGGSELPHRSAMYDYDRAIAVREVIARLPPLHRVILVLNQFGGLTTDQIGVRLGKPPGTIGRKLAEAKEMFRHHYRREDSWTDSRLLES